MPLPPDMTHSKQHRSPRPSSLYEALVNPSKQRRGRHYNDQNARFQENVASATNGETIDDRIQLAFRDRLADCIETENAEGASTVLDDIVAKGYIPTGRAVIMAIDAAIASGQLPLGERALSYLDDRLDDGVALSARTVLAVAFSTRGAYTDALRVMQLKDWEAFANSGSIAIAAQVDQLSLGRDTVAWGVLIKSLTKLGYPRTAVTVVDLAMKQSVGMTDSMLHLTIDALRRVGKWEEAIWLFDRALEKGVVPHERTLASALLALTGRQARMHVDVKKVEEIIDMAPNPSGKFMSVALMALSSVGSLVRTEQLFYELSEMGTEGIADEIAFSCMMTAYSCYLDRYSDEDERQREKIYVEISHKADDLWHSYLKAYRLQRPSGMTRSEREMMLSKYLRTKTRCFCSKEAVATLEEITERKEMYPWLDIRLYHVTAVMGAVELSCDVGLMERLLNVMRRNGLQHDMRSLAFTVGTVIGDGDMGRGLTFVREEASDLLLREELRGGFRDYYPALLLRRLRLLASGFMENGSGSVPDLDNVIEQVEEFRVKCAVDGGRSGKRNPRKPN